MQVIYAAWFAFLLALAILEAALAQGRTDQPGPVGLELSVHGGLVDSG